MDDLSAEEAEALADLARANVAADPALFDRARELAVAGLDEYRRAHAALGLAVVDLEHDAVAGQEALAVFRACLAMGDELMDNAGRLLVFGCLPGDNS